MVGLAEDDGRTVTAAKKARALEIGRAFAEIIRDEPIARELWVTVDTEEPGTYLWLVIDPVDMGVEYTLFGSPMDRLFERFPREVVWLMPVNPRTHRGGRPSLMNGGTHVPLGAG